MFKKWFTAKQGNSVDKVSLAEIYKTPSASPLPFPHLPWYGATTNAFFLPPHTCPGRKFIPLSSSEKKEESFIRELCSPGQAEIPSLSSHLYFHGKAIKILQRILPPRKHTISALGKHPREQHPGCCTSTLCSLHESRMFQSLCGCTDIGVRTTTPQEPVHTTVLSKLYTVHILIKIASIKWIDLHTQTQVLYT